MGKEKGQAPVMIGETLTEKCISIGKKGDGIFKIDGFTIIVPKTEVNKTYEIQITTVLETVAFGEVVQEPDVQEDTENFGEDER
jgi:predicted RNA-binding protein with TRAM domain